MQNAPALRRVEQLFELYEQKMYRIAYAILHDEGQAEDAVMAAFERIVRGGSVPAHARSIEAERLVLRIIKQTSIDQYRKNAREGCVVRPFEESDLIAFANSTTLASAHEGAAGGMPGAQGDEGSQEGFESLIAPLNEPYQEVLRERFGKDRTVRETAHALGISEANVRTRQHRAVEMLRREYGDANGYQCN